MPSHTELTVAGKKIDARTAGGREAVGDHFRVRVDARGDDKPADLVGKDFELRLLPRLGGELVVRGIVRSASMSFARGSQELALELGPESELLRLGQTSHVYLDKHSREITAAVLAGAGVAAAKWNLSAAPPKRTTTTQYREADWTFIDRITREDGLFSFHDHTGDASTLTFTSDSTKADAVDGTFLHRRRHGTVATERWVSSISSRIVAATDALATRDRDPLKPSLGIEARETKGEGALEVYTWPARLDASGGVAGRAKTSLEALRAMQQLVTGQAATADIRCGKIFHIESSAEGEAPLPEALQRLFCVAVVWRMDESGVFSLGFTGVPAAVPFRLPLRPGARRPLGVETAWVRGARGQEIDVDEHARVFVQPPWDRDGTQDDTCSSRTRVGQPSLARSMAIPRVGWSVLLGHHDGDVDRAWVMARLVDGTHPPPYKLPDNMTRTSWQTLTSSSDGTLSEIVFEDKASSEQILIHAARDMAVEIGDNEARTVGNRHVLEVTEDRTVTIDADEKLTVTKDQKTTVKGDESTTVAGSRSLTVKGNEEATIAGSRSEKITKDRTYDVGKKRTLTVGGSMSTSSKKGITREVLKKLTATVGGASSLETDQGLVSTTKGDAEETIAGARAQNGKAGIQTLVKGDLKETIAAAHAVSATGSVGESAKGKMKLTLGAALSATAPQVEIVADSELTIVCGGSTIAIKSSEVSIKASTVAFTGPLVTSNGATVKHNP